MQKLKKSFKLKQFKNENSSINDFEVSMEVKDSLFLLSYSICGNISDIIIPGIENFTDIAEDNYKRKDELWKATCFELFFSDKSGTSYIEVNVSPDYYYNIYNFSAYRTGMKEENNLSLKNIEIIKKDSEFILKFAVKTQKLISMNNLLVNITAVIKYNTEKTEYWALKHCRNKADFHDFNTFVDFT